MSYSFNNNDKDTTLTPESVTAFLTANPDFFKQNPTVLESLQLSQGATANVAPLIERQVSVLREKNAQLERTILNNKKLAVCRQHLQQHVYSLTQDILRCQSLNALSELLGLSLNKWFVASQLRLFIFNLPGRPKQIGNIVFTGDSFAIQDMFSGVLNRRKPLCSSLQAEHLQALFQQHAEQVRSNVIIPVYGHKWSGLLALGSSNWDQYGQGEELDMLVFISHLLGHQFDHLVAAELSS